jgi:hypothetical protein
VAAADLDPRLARAQLGRADRRLGACHDGLAAAAAPRGTVGDGPTHGSVSLGSTAETGAIAGDYSGIGPYRPGEAVYDEDGVDIP